jgi:hypothetical protein
MNDLDTESTLLLASVKDAFNGVTMPTPLSDIVIRGKARRRRRRAVRAGVLSSAAAVVAASIAVVAWPAAPPPATTGGAATDLQVRTVAYTLDKHPDGTITLKWTKQAYISDPAGLQAALERVGFPVLIKVGEFCKGPSDDGYLDPSGQGRGVDAVMRATRSGDDVVFTFYPAAMPADTELFIGYLSPAQLAVTGGRPGSVERLVPTSTALDCDTQAPPGHPAVSAPDRKPA